MYTQHICIVGVCVCANTRLGIVKLFGHLPNELWRYSITAKFGGNSDSVSVFVKQNKH